MEKDNNIGRLYASSLLFEEFISIYHEGLYSYNLWLFEHFVESSYLPEYKHLQQEDESDDM
jgi:hypothetical protein